MSQSLLISLLVAGGLALIFGLFLYYAGTLFRKTSQDISYNRQLNHLIGDDGDEDELMQIDKGRNVVEKWNIHWGKMAKISGISRYQTSTNSAGQDAVFLLIILIVLAGVFLGLIWAIPAGCLGLFIISFMLGAKHRASENAVSDQIPGFLFAMKLLFGLSSKSLIICQNHYVAIL